MPVLRSRSQTDLIRRLIFVEQRRESRVEKTNRLRRNMTSQTSAIQALLLAQGFQRNHAAFMPAKPTIAI